MYDLYAPPLLIFATLSLLYIRSCLRSSILPTTHRLFRQEYPIPYLLVRTFQRNVNYSLIISSGAVLGQIIVGLICDRIGRKVALVSTTGLIVLGATLATASRGTISNPSSLFWFLTFARGLTGIVGTFDANRSSTLR